MSASDDYIDLLFHDENDRSKQFWINLLKCVESVVNLLSLSNFVIATIGMIVNMFHILVLIQKLMRTLTINAFLTGIAICDFMRMACVVFLSLPLFNLLYFQSTVANEWFVQIQKTQNQKIEVDSSKSPQYYFTMVASNFCASTNKLVQNLSVWYGVTIAVLRAMVLRYPLNSSQSQYLDSLTLNFIRLHWFLKELHAKYFHVFYFR
ncbi:hypothetical protein CAEBREN_08671 [Caenorhabditis brenneri]|uniref:G-protein coupled receptors family 1 profile domain-containing protein n=1 Tax=Caenorhabditis brenneri TaxID=135651 RepID=G0P668_CAEBE|nr:hypothetical protein CAEBREN_08671 [Caenorhabditis brenneri]